MSEFETKIRKDQLDIVDESINMKKGGISIPMGGGKTLIALTIIERLKGLNLVVVSKSLIGNWKGEIDKFFGNKLNYEILHPEFIKNIGTWVPHDNTQLIITTPEIIAKAFTEGKIDEKCVVRIRNGFEAEIKHYLRPTKVYSQTRFGLQFLFGIQWRSLFIDEIQKHNNVSTDKCMGIASIYATYRFGLSGTMFDEPKPERIMGWIIMLDLDIIEERTLPKLKELLKDKKFTGLEKYNVSRTKMDGFELPDYTEIIVNHELTHDEQVVYKTMKTILNKIRVKAAQLRARGDLSAKKFSVYILAIITYLRQCLICPLVPLSSVMIDAADCESKSELAAEINNSIKEQKLDVYLNNESSIYSSRIQSVLNILSNESNKKIIVFSTFISCLNLVEHCISEKNKDRKLLKMTSCMSSTTRERLISQFNETNDNTILLLSYDLGAEGLNLQSCSRIILLDFWWNEGKTKQAIKRIYRQGQMNDVKVYMMISNTGIERAIFEKQNTKKEILNDYKTGCSDKKVKTLSTEEILQIIDNSENVNMLKKLSLN